MRGIWHSRPTEGRIASRLKWTTWPILKMLRLRRYLREPWSTRNITSVMPSILSFLHSSRDFVKSKAFTSWNSQTTLKNCHAAFTWRSVSTKCMMRRTSHRKLPISLMNSNWQDMIRTTYWISERSPMSVLAPVCYQEWNLIWQVWSRISTHK